MSVTIDTEAVKQLRLKTSAGIVECKKALTEADGDFEKAVEILRKKGIALASKKSSRAAKEGLIESYIHAGGKIGVLVEINCETDFVARCDEFKQLIKDVALQVAAQNPAYLKREDIPAEVLEKEKEVLAAQVQGKPENIIDKIVEGKLDKFYQDVCLLEQPFIKDPKVSINDLITNCIAKIGENIVLRRFVRFQLGE